MQRIGARLHGVIEVAACDLTIFRRKIAGLDLYFLDSVHAGGLALLLENLPDGPGGILAFDADGFAIAWQSVHYQGAVYGESHAGKKERRLQRVADIAGGAATARDRQDGELIHSFDFDRVAHFAAFGLEQRRRVGDRHRLSCRSDLELHIAARVCGCDYLYVLLNILPEASHVHRKLVGPRGHWDCRWCRY